jgi:hypothetical protein
MGLASIYQTAQIGVETVAGTAVAANKKLTSVGFSMSPNPDISVFRAAGNKYPSVAALNREWTEIDLEGAITYTEIVYLLSGILETAVITTSGTTGQQWTFTPSSTAADTIKTFTIEQGSAGQAHRVAYGLVSDLTLSFGREESTIGGSLIATALEDGITLTPAPTEIALVPVTGPQISVYAADTVAGLAGATKLAGAISVEWSLTNRFGPAWFLNGENEYSQHVELEPTLEMTLMQEADAEGMELLPIMRTGATKYIRIEAVGGVIGLGPATYKFTLDTACKVTDIGDFSDQEGVYAIEYTLGGFHDATLGGACKAVVINALTAL